MCKEPKFGHLRDLHNVIRSYQKAFLTGEHSSEKLGPGYEVGNIFFHHLRTWKLRYCLTVLRDLEINILPCSDHCRHTPSSCLKKTCASLSSPTTTQGKMELWSSEGRSTMCLAVLSPFLQGARTWFTIPREYASYTYPYQIKTHFKVIRNIGQLYKKEKKNIGPWFVLCSLGRCLYNTVKGHSIPQRLRARINCGKCSQNRFRGITALKSGQRNP